ARELEPPRVVAAQRGQHLDALTPIAKREVARERQTREPCDDPGRRRERTAEQRRRGLRAGVSGNERDGDAVARGDPDPVEARDPHSEQLAEAAVAETNEGSESRHVAPSLLGTPERPMLARGSPRFSVEAPSEAASAPRNELES